MPFMNIFKQTMPWKEFLPAFIIVFNSLTWYTLILTMFTSTVNNLSYSSVETLMIFIVHYVGVACSAILGSIIFPRARAISLFSWIIIGTVASALLITVSSNSILINAFISLFLGISIGIGIPSCLAYFGDATSVEKRGFYGGITWSAVGFGVLFLATLISSLDLVLTFLTLAVWRGLGLIAFLFTRDKEKIQPTQGSSTYLAILRRTDVILYLVPWIMFCLVNFSETPILEKMLGDLFTFVSFIEFALAGFFALLGGILADIVGRKRVIMAGFVLLGVEYAVLSLFYEMPFSLYIYTVLDSIAWGVFASIFFMTLWGDLAAYFGKEKYYLLGGLSYVLSGFLPMLVRPYADVIPLNMSFSLASFFLFLAVLPLMYAPETLPEKKIKERELKGYIEKAKKIREKQT